jgi:hypothetical protein
MGRQRNAAVSVLTAAQVVAAAAATLVAALEAIAVVAAPAAVVVATEANGAAYERRSLFWIKEAANWGGLMGSVSFFDTVDQVQATKPHSSNL